MAQLVEVVTVMIGGVALYRWVCTAVLDPLEAFEAAEDAARHALGPGTPS